MGAMWHPVLLLRMYITIYVPKTNWLNDTTVLAILNCSNNLWNTCYRKFRTIIKDPKFEIFGRMFRKQFRFIETSRSRRSQWKKKAQWPLAEVWKFSSIPIWQRALIRMFKSTLVESKLLQLNPKPIAEAWKNNFRSRVI